MDDMIACPSCGNRFEVGTAMREHFEAELRQRLEADAKRRIAEARAEVERANAKELAERQSEVEATREKLRAAGDREAELLRRQRELEEREVQVQLEVERGLAEQTSRIREEADRTAEGRFAQRMTEELRRHEEELAAARKRVDEAAGKEAELLRRQRELEEREGKLQLDVELRLAAETVRIREETERTSEERHARRLAEELRQKDEELTEARKRIEGIAEKETALLRRQCQLEDREQQAALDLERKLVEERTRIRDDLTRQAGERAELERQQQRLRDQEHQEQIDGLKRHAVELQRRLEQGSQQLQGEAQEIVLRDALAKAFPRDEIGDVGKGVQGADVTQLVRDEEGRDCGLMIWESKRTKSWSDEWLAKLRDDQRATGAVCAIVVTQALPIDVRTFGQREGVWVSDWSHAVGLAAVLRAGLIEVAQARRTAEGRGDKMQVLYDYLTGPEFRNRVGGVVEAFAEMRDDLEAEKRAMISLWKKRQRQLERALENLSAFHGDLRGIAGRQLAELPELMLPSGKEESVDVASVDPERDDDDGVAEIGLSLGPVDQGLTELLLALIPDDCSTVGNKSLAERFCEEALLQLERQVSLGDYARCKGALLEQGRIRRGMGRGGSVARIDPGPALVNEHGK
jgi:hypothetical protein